jgi:arginase
MTPIAGGSGTGGRLTASQAAGVRFGDVLAAAGCSHVAPEMGAVSRPLAVIGVPTSAGAFAPGQERAPAALRAAGLLDRLHEAGIATRDDGDRPVWRWRPDRANRRAQNLGAVVEIVGETTRRVGAAVAAGEATLVLGGDCTVGIGAVAGHVAGARQRVGVVYFDSHADLNVPSSVHEGALDWMGMAHMLGEDGASGELAAAGGRTPLLEADQVVLLGWGPDQATAFERAAIARRGLRVVAVDRVAADPEAAALEARRLIGERCERLVVHFDVDVIDFTDTPLSENWGRNEGVGYEQAMRALRVLLAAPSLAGLTITELNPDHAEDEETLTRFTAAIVAALADAPAIRRAGR